METSARANAREFVAKIAENLGWVKPALRAEANPELLAILKNLQEQVGSATTM
jgi:hypothetical protein